MSPFCLGFGPELAAEVRRVFERVAANPSFHPPVFADVRKGVVRRFPYCIFYRPDADRAEALAVSHASRGPAVWHGHAGSEM